MKIFSAFVSGLLFSIGLVVSGMTQPSNIIGFLDFFGEWKPALMFVMAGALSIYAALRPLVIKRKKPLFELAFDTPSNKKIDLRLLVGSAAFGVGWGLGGFCPGPALASLGTGAPEVLIFFLSMITGIGLYRLSNRNNSASSGSDTDSCG